MSDAIKTVTDTSFETEVLGSEVPVLVDYWAEWCAPCRAISSLVDDSATSYAGQLRVAKVNIDQNPKTPNQYHVRSIPTLMLFKNGQPVATKVGALNKAQLAAFIEDNL
jgi:thioredoxin 1